MKTYNQGHYGSIEKALQGVGLKVDSICKQGKKTVITVLRCGTSDKGVTAPVRQKAANNKGVLG